MATARKREKKEKGIIDQLLDNIGFRVSTQDGAVGQGGLIKQLTGRMLQKALEAEMAERLGYEKNSNEGDSSGNSRGGHAEKTALLESQSTAIEAPRDLNGTFEPVTAPEHEKRAPLFNDQIISVYSYGMAGRDIEPHLEKTYNAEAPPDLTGRVTDAVLEEAGGRQNRPLEKPHAVACPYPQDTLTHCGLKAKQMEKAV
jgi:transposase-like protein